MRTSGRDEARAQIEAGLDPAQERKRARIAAKNTFKDRALEWLAKCECEGRASVTIDKIRWLLDMASCFRAALLR
jgi:hypothetical protein